MNVLKKVAGIAALGCIMGIVGGCATSNLVDVWHDPSYKAAPLNKMLVIVVRKDAAKRRIWEDAFAHELAKHGVSTTSSYTLFPEALPDTNQVIASVSANGFDGILVVLRLPTETDKQYIPGYTTYTQQDLRYSSYWQRYRTYYLEIDHPGYVDSQTVDIRAIDVTTTGDKGRMIWSARSRTPAPSSVIDVQQEIADLVIQNLAHRKIIRSEK